MTTVVRVTRRTLLTALPILPTAVACADTRPAVPGLRAQFDRPQIVNVLDSTMSYREATTNAPDKTAAPIVFLHGNPTSSYLWRNVIPAIGGAGRLLAPDLIGMGDSGKPKIGYTYADQARYLDAWFDALKLTDVILVGHDWGGTLAFDWAARHRDRVRGVAFTEAVIKPMTWEQFPEAGREMFRAVKTPGVGEEIVLNQNAFIEKGLTGTVVTPLSAQTLDEYRRPYPTPESRVPLLQWGRANPIEGDPADVVARVNEFGKWLAASTETPKLMLTFEPGPGTTFDATLIAWAAANMAALDVKKLGPAGHQTPEDQPAAIAAAVTEWADKHRLR